MKKQAASTPDIEAFLKSHMRVTTTETPEMVEDLRYFARRAKEGSVISREGLREWMMKKYGAETGRSRLYGMCIRNGIQPWFSK